MNSTDSIPTFDGDEAFIGVDMRLPPQNLPNGLVSEARNARFRYGVAEPRKGLQYLTWTQLTGQYWPIVWPIYWNSPVEFGTPVSVGKFDDPNGVEWMLIAATDPQDTDDVKSVRIFAVSPNNQARRVPVSVALDDSTPFWFTQCFNTCVLHRGNDASTLSMTNVGDGFETVSQINNSTDTGDGTEDIPNGINGLFFRNRLLIPHREGSTGKTDVVGVSDYLNYTKYLPLFGDFRINQGDSDNIVALDKFNDDTVIVFKDNSIYGVTNAYGDLQVNARLDQITDEYGLVGARTVAQCGNDLLFLSQWGVTSIGQTIDNKTQALSKPLSEPMQPVIDRINWEAAKTTACAEYWRDRYYLSVPLDGSTQNNAVLVYDFHQQAWSGYDYWGGNAQVAFFMKGDFVNGEQLYYVDYNGVMGLYEFAEEDFIVTTGASFNTDVIMSCVPTDGSLLTVNNGTTIRATRQRELTDENGDFLQDDLGNDLVEDTATNPLDDLGNSQTDDSGNPIWGVSYDDPTGKAAANLWQGFSQLGWDGNATASQIQGGVRFTSNIGPVTVDEDDDCIQVFTDGYKQPESSDIDFMIVTRGYNFAAGYRGRTVNTQVYIGTWAAQYKVTAKCDGVQEETVLIDESNTATYPDGPRSRLKYTTFTADDWVPSNVNEDFSEPYREDYSMVSGNVDSDTYAMSLGDGVSLDEYQWWTNKLTSEKRGAYFQVKIESLTGRIKIASVTAATLPGSRRFNENAR